ncbi:helix-turn-helix domain-containing protein [Acetobacter estunensis]|uniref:helix-turn-helix domain-containing protein n=1 Tax=Acetobacter estunensis TaxID=104097 RepID=UPI0034A04483
MLDIKPEQCLGARAMLRLTRGDLADAAQVAVATLADFEAGKRTPHPRTLSAIRTALESAGVEFIAENGGGAGVRLKKERGEA